MSRVLTDAPSNESALSEANVIAAVQSLTAFSVQSATEAGLGTNSAANILYSTASRTQGNFTIFYAIALDKLTEDLALAGKTATSAQQEKALAYLIGDLQEKKDPDAVAKSVSFDGYSVSRDGGKTGYMQMYEDLVKSLPSVTSSVLSASDLECTGQVRDASDYPDSWRLTELESTDIDPF